MRIALFFACGAVCGSALAAQSFEYLPGTSYDPDVPSVRSVLGFEPGERISSHAEVERYLRALADGSDRVALRRYGETWEGRALYYLVVTSARNQRRLDAIQDGMQRLADPRELDEGRANALVSDLPAVAWLAFAVHGDEISGTDAALQLAYHLAAATDDELAATILDQAVVIIDPLQNPDGRERFVQAYRSTRGRWPDAEPLAAEHDQPWPGGRTNHYLFDMNRDWFALTQPETRGRVRAFLEWRPVVYVDLHEMGSNSTYYFAPPARPYNPEITASQRSWLGRYGRNNADWFDRFGFAYFTRENYDSFYPGYGDGWPMVQGAIGMTFEQASVRGLVVRRDDETEMRYRDSVQHHFIAALGTAETAARSRSDALRAFLDYRRGAIEEGRTGPVREFVLPQGRDPHRTTRLADLLTRQGIEVHRATTVLECAAARELAGGEPAARTFPPGTYVVRLAQPAKHLATTLLARHQEMEAEFLERQKRRYGKRQRTEFYDLTGWSMPLLFGVDCYTTDRPSRGELELVTTRADEVFVREASAGSARTEAKVAYVIPSGSNHTAMALAELLREGLRVHCADEPFRIGDRRFAAGSLLVRVPGNGPEVHAVVAELDATLGLDVYAADSSWVDDGIDFGSNRMRFLEKPKVLLAYDRPVRSYSVGWARYLLDRVYGYPATIVRTRQLGRADLDRFNVLILPDGSGYGDAIGERGAARIKEWVRRGGTLVALGGATRWLTSKGVELLASEAEKRAKPDGDGEPRGEKRTYDYESAVLPDEEQPGRTPGAILRVALDSEHWLAFGCGETVNVVSTGSSVYTPVKLDKGTNVGVYAARDELLLSGFAWDDKLDQLARKPWLVHQPHGKGHVVAFAEDPNTRAFNDATNLLFLNAVLLGPGH